MAEEGEESAADVEVTEEPIAAEADDAGTRQADVTPGIVRVQAYDAGSDDAEDDPAAAALAEADSSATWSTECSADPQPGGTQVVGLVVTFDRRTERPLIVDVQSAPSQIQFYAATTRRVPSTLEQWGAPVGAVMVEALPAEVPSPPYGEPVRHVLVVFDEVPSDPGCADTEPYRGTIGDVRPAE